MNAVVDVAAGPITASFPLTFTLLSPLHHGAGTSGNSQLLRTQEVVLPDGTAAVVPFVSGNSLRHVIRQALADWTLDVIDAPPGSLTKPVVDLLYSGGALTTSDSAQIDVGFHRRLDAIWAPAGLLGYAGRGQIWAGTLYVDHLGLVCAENAWRLPGALSDHPHAGLSAAALRDEDFGTRKDAAGTSADRWLDLDLWADGGDERKTTQMIYDWQVIKAGATLYGTLRLACASREHAQALRVAWRRATPSGVLHLGAKRAQGYGLCRVDVDLSALPEPDGALERRLRERRDDLVGMLVAAAGK